MFSKSNLVPFIGAALWAYFGGFFLWSVIGGVLLSDNLGSATGVMRSNPLHFMLILGCVILALLFTVLYSKWSRGYYSISQGVQFGMLLGIFQGFGSGMIDYATSNMLSLTGFLINALLYVVYYVIMGVITSILFSKFSK
ncbi:hypothetical protein [Tenacibaculum sp. UWU-22]|uniref:hypothetical protein n=1 Tax=Tenacibaculum sp. UWU-22 TaxID=3234187 RepID=UPI0034DADFC9